MSGPIPAYDYKQVNLGVRSNPLRDGRNGSARLINCFYEAAGEESITGSCIHAWPGLRNLTSEIDEAGIRQQIVYDTALYVVCGRNLYKVNAFGGAQLIGGIPTDGPVYMELNRVGQIGIVSDGLYYVLENDVLTQINDVDLPPPVGFSYHDGYGLWLAADGRWGITGLDNFGTVDGLDFTTAESNPDGGVAIKGFEREVYVFGPKSIESYQNTGNADFPYERSGATNIGCLAGNTVASVETESANMLLFVASDHSVRRLQGLIPERVSTNEIDELIKTYHRAGNDLSLMRATAWSDGGRYFYSLSCPDWTRVYCARYNAWIDAKSKAMPRWRVDNVVRFGTALVGGDYYRGQLYELSTDYYDEAGDELVCTIITPAMHMAPYRMLLNSVKLLMETGVGLGVGDDHDTDPRIMIKISRDGGRTWHGYEEIRLGKLGRSRTEQRSHRWGWGDERGLTLSISCSAKVMRKFYGLWAATQQLAV